MTQASLLERAKQGDPESIAALMNMTLQPKGITATAKTTGNCLQVFLTSERVLNQVTMANFVRRGLKGLDVSSIQLARIYAHKVGEVPPVWIEEIVVDQEEELAEANQPLMQSIAPPGNSLSVPWANLNQPLAALKDRLPALEATARQVATQAQIYGRRYWQEAERLAAQVQIPSQLSSLRFTPKKYVVTLAIATLPAFLLGAVVAIIASSASSDPNGGNGSTKVGSASQMAINADTGAAIATQQIEVRKYLTKMNQAQKDFYKKNNRFAGSLEELERSASTISLLSGSRNYTYKLTTPDGTYALLTAIPREDGFKSFTGVVFLDQNATSTVTPITTICETVQPSKTPPETPRATSGVLQCPPGSDKAS